MNTTSKSIVNCEIAQSIATITMNDGKNNLISPTMLKQVNKALDEAEKANAVAILTGTGDVFSAGFDLKILRSGVLDTFKMLIGGFQLSKRLLAFPTPVIIACNGHAMAMGSFLLLSGDYRIGVQGEYKVVANEVEIGLTMPYAAIALCRQRLKPAHFDRAVLLSELYNPQSAIDAGFLDDVVSRQELMATAYEKAKHFASLDLAAHKGSKLRMRRSMLRGLTKAIRADKLSFVAMGVKRALGIR